MPLQSMGHKIQKSLVENDLHRTGITKGLISQFMYRLKKKSHQPLHPHICLEEEKGKREQAQEKS